MTGVAAVEGVFFGLRCGRYLDCLNHNISTSDISTAATDLSVPTRRLPHRAFPLFPACMQQHIHPREGRFPKNMLKMDRKRPIYWREPLCYARAAAAGAVILFYFVRNMLVGLIVFNCCVIYDTRHLVRSSVDGCRDRFAKQQIAGHNQPLSLLSLLSLGDALLQALVL